MPAPRMVPVTSASNAVEARIIAARLGAEGLLWELRGGVDGPYPVGEVEVLVAETDLSVARDLLLSDEVERAFDHGSFDGRAPRELWFVLVAMLAVAAFTLVRLLATG